ncbi:MAG: hypothetical protein CME17_03280 [Gemmatimonadetes bacterium]|nr:hypothetical protein [Gemmatimonadota bacterium]
MGSRTGSGIPRKLTKTSLKIFSISSVSEGLKIRRAFGLVPSRGVWLDSKPSGRNQFEEGTMNRFTVGLVSVAAVVSYLIWTGVSETMVYYLTPVELMEKVESDRTFYEVGVKVSGQVLPGTYQRVDGELLHTFVVRDLADESVTFPVEFRDALPDTFTDDAEVVLEGSLRGDGVFEAETLLTKCGSRYEAAPEDLAG